jgi:hypothetical protein
MKTIVNIIFVTLVLSSCQLRTSSKIRFEKACEIQFPRKYDVVQDEYQDMLQDFVIHFTIKLDTTSQKNLSSSIRCSKYYNKNYFLQRTDSMIEISDHQTEAIWVKSSKGYRFDNRNLRHNITAIIDTIQQQAEFTESND